MNWNLRYATTKKSIRELKAILPEGWQHVTTGQPQKDTDWFDTTEKTDLWKPIKPDDWFGPKQKTVAPIEPSANARRNRVKKPDVHLLFNPTTGNSATIYDHSKMNEDTRKAYWNPIDHGDSIHAALTKLDQRANNTRLRFTRHNTNISNLRVNPDIFSVPDEKHINSGLPWEQDANNDHDSNWAALDHELGHNRMNRDKSQMYAYLNMIIDHHNKNSLNKVDKDKILKSTLYDNRWLSLIHI